MSRNLTRAICALAIMAFAGAAFAQEKPDSKLPIRKVVLYKHGVGYFERLGKVEGEEQISLRFKAKDMGDLLKSLTVLDLNGGTVRTISYDSTKTPEQQLGEYTFDLRSAQGLAAILEQMKGSILELRVGGNVITGRILSVEKRVEKRNNDTVTETHRLSILLDDGAVKFYDLTEISDLRFVDPKLQADMSDYLKTLFSRHRRDEKEMTLLAAGKGERNLFVSYVREQPVWKVSYRIVTEGDKKPLLQAWAIVDNVSEEDWKDVRLSLVSGLPVSFIQNLYDPWYVKRPVIKPALEVSMAPVLYEAGVMMDKADEGKLEMRGARKRMADRPGEAEGYALAPPAPSMGGVMPTPNMFEAMTQQATAAAAHATAALFVYDIKETVSIKRDRSALLPIANANVDGDRVSIYNASVRAENPMDGFRLKNTTGLTLEGGPVTVIVDDTYAGEAIIDTVKQNDMRYISYAVDLGTRVVVTPKPEPEQITKIRIVNGTMIIESKLREMNEYMFQNLEEKDKKVVVEHPIRAGWSLVKTAEPIEKTSHLYRFEASVAAGKKVPFVVTEEFPQRAEHAVINMSPDFILQIIRQRKVDAKVEKFLQEVAARQAEIAELNNQNAEDERQYSQARSERTEMSQMIQRLGGSEGERRLRDTYVAKMTEAQTSIDTLNTRMKERRQQIMEKQKALNQFIKDFQSE